jgi:two-component system chemotaxis response regulator CheY
MFSGTTKVLVVDDMRTMRKIVTATLQQCGFKEIVEADDGATAWPLLEQAAATDKPFGLVLSDWNMPKMPGIELLKKVRGHASPALKTLPFLLVTAEAEQKNIIEAVQAGVSNYVVKPFSPAQLQDKLNQVQKKLAAANTK